MQSTPTSCEMPSTSCMHCDDARRITILSSDTDPIPCKSSVIASGDILDKISKAEILWCLNVVIQHESYRSCEGLAELFGSMFPDSQIANKFSLGKDKVRYSIVYGLAPYFHIQFAATLKACGMEFSISFDESLNKFLQKGQMDVHIRFWDISRKQAVTRYWNSVFLGKATAEDLLKAFHSGLEHLHMDSILQVSMDGPKVNWAFYDKLVNEQADDAAHFLETGSCGLHIMHGAFQSGHNATDWKVNEVLSALWYYFKDSPARRAEFQSICGPEVCAAFPLKFCKCRWVENSSVANRALQIWPHIQKYISSCTKTYNSSFKSIQFACTDHLFQAKLSFFKVFKVISDDLNPFLLMYQTNAPMMPFLCEDWGNTLLTILKRFIRREAIVDLSFTRLSKIDVCDKELQLQLKDIDIGFATKQQLLNVRVGDQQRMAFLVDCRIFLQRVAKKMLERSPLRYSCSMSNFDLSQFCFKYVYQAFIFLTITFTYVLSGPKANRRRHCCTKGKEKTDGGSSCHTT